MRAEHTREAVGPSQNLSEHLNQECLEAKLDLETSNGNGCLKMAMKLREKIPHTPDMNACVFLFETSSEWMN